MSRAADRVDLIWERGTDEEGLAFSPQIPPLLSLSSSLFLFSAGGDVDVASDDVSHTHDRRGHLPGHDIYNKKKSM